jgi:signal transduction histidine kinase
MTGVEGRKYGIYYLVPALVIIIVLAILDWSLVRNPDPEKLTQTFREQLSAAGNETRQVLNLFSGGFDTLNFDYPAPADDRIGLFAFRNDSLVYWSTNNISAGTEEITTMGEGPLIRRLGNGWYLLYTERRGGLVYVAARRIKSAYPYENDYLKNSFAPGFTLPDAVDLKATETGFPVKDNSGKTIISLSFSNLVETPCHTAGLSVLLFLAGWFLMLMFMLRAWQALEAVFKRPLLLVVLVWVDVILLRTLQYLLQFPRTLYRSELFSPTWYSSSVMLPSLGDFMINALLLVFMAYVLFRYRKAIRFRTAGPLSFIFSAAVVGLAFIWFLGTGTLTGNLVMDSSFPLNLQDISSLGAVSLYGLMILSGLYAAFWFGSATLLYLVTGEVFSWKRYAMVSGTAIAAAWVIGLAAGWTPGYQQVLFFILYLAGYGYLVATRESKLSPAFILFCLFFFAVNGTYLLNRANQYKEQEKRKVLAMKLSTRRNPVTELLFSQIAARIISAPEVQKALESYSAAAEAKNDTLAGYITARYISDYWSRFNVLLTICDGSKTLRVQPSGYLVNCGDYFRETVESYGIPTQDPNLYFLDYGFGNENYLGILSLGNKTGNGAKGSARIYIELSLKPVYRDLGYPELLVDRKRVDRPDLGDYSYALFRDGQLVYSVGAYTYRLALWKNLDPGYGWPFSGKGGMEHYFFRFNDRNTMLVSRKEASLLLSISPFPYLFILFALVALILAAMISGWRWRHTALTSLRNRLQLSMIGVLVLSFIITGIVLIINIVELNTRKNDDILREKAQSVLIELQHKFSTMDDLGDIPAEDLENLLIKFSNVFFSDINLYAPSGALVATSRPQVFGEGLIAGQMNAAAFRQMKFEKRSLYIHDESIGSNHYSSAYLPFFNDRDRLMGYVNLPYFSRQDELKKEISSFLVTFINIYILFILLGVFLTFLISKYITSPLALLSGKMAGLQLGRTNERIDWKRGDEIGRLVEEYNRMVDELARSAEKLATSERESAWREMARQVAHEIKNPLTPMKLSVQYLQKAWNEGMPDMDERIAKFSKTLVEQIDTLSSIASGFSDFAQMPVSVGERIELRDIIGSVLGLYKDNDQVEIVFLPPPDPIHIFADKKQMVRVLTNLLNNAVQAIGSGATGTIRVTLGAGAGEVRVAISDDGPGIPEELRPSIFQPNFTTKSGGTGLGLAMVREIVHAIGGTISFTSEVGKGTTFTLVLPAVD